MKKKNKTVVVSNDIPLHHVTYFIKEMCGPMSRKPIGCLTRQFLKKWESWHCVCLMICVFSTVKTVTFESMAANDGQAQC